MHHESTTIGMLVQAALARAIGALVSDASYIKTAEQEPFNLLIFVSVLHAFFRNHRLIETILHGKYRDFSEIPDIL